MKQNKLEDANKSHQQYASARPVIPGTSLKYELY